MFYEATKHVTSKVSHRPRRRRVSPLALFFCDCVHPLATTLGALVEGDVL